MNCEHRTLDDFVFRLRFLEFFQVLRLHHQLYSIHFKHQKVDSAVKHSICNRDCHCCTLLILCILQERYGCIIYNCSKGYLLEEENNKSCLIEFAPAPKLCQDIEEDERISKQDEDLHIVAHQINLFQDFLIIHFIEL